MKNNLISAFIGALIAIMTLFNGTLSNTFESYTSSIIIHVIGLFSITFVLLISRSKFKIQKEIPIYYIVLVP